MQNFIISMNRIGKKGYKKNKYKYDDRTIRLVEENWDFALKQWDYNL